MRRFLIVTVKWLIAIALLASVGFLGWRFHTNYTLARQYVGDQSYLQTGQLHKSNTIGISSRAPELVAYAPLDILSKQRHPIQIKHYDNEQTLWDDLFQDKVEFILVSLDQFALRVMSQPCQIAFPYAISQGLDTVVCVPNWDSLPTAKPRRVAYVTNTTSAYVAQYLANQLMDSDSPVQLVGASSPGEAQELLQSGQVEAASLSQPYVGTLVNKGYLELPNWTPPAIYEVCVSRPTITEDRQTFVVPLFRKFAASLFNSLEKMRTMPGPLYTQIARLSGKDRQVVRQTLGEHITFLDGTGAYELMQSGNLAAQLQQTLEFWLMSGTYPAPLSAQVPSDPAKLILDSAGLRGIVNIDQESHSAKSSPDNALNAADSSPEHSLNSTPDSSNSPQNSPEPTSSEPYSSSDSPAQESGAPPMYEGEYSQSAPHSGAETNIDASSDFSSERANADRSKQDGLSLRLGKSRNNQSADAQLEDADSDPHSASTQTRSDRKRH